jgi:hypothetical protein
MLPSVWQQQLQHAAHALQQGQQQRTGLRQAIPCSQRLQAAAAPSHTGQHIGSSINRKQHGQMLQRTSVSTAAASISSCTGSDSTPGALLISRRSRQCCCSLPQAKLPQQQRMAQHGSKQRQRSAQLARAASRPPPDPWQQPPGTGGVGTAADWNGNYGPPNGNGSNGRQSPNGSYDAWDAAAVPPAGNGNGSRNGMPSYDQTDWGWTSKQQDAWGLPGAVVCTVMQRVGSSGVTAVFASWPLRLVGRATAGTGCHRSSPSMWGGRNQLLRS